jgi:hypothetical protein
MTFGSHSLVDLYNHLNALIGKIIPQISNQPTRKQLRVYLDDIEKLAMILNELDKHSDAFRYPVDKKAVPHFDREATIDLNDYIKLFYKVQDFFRYSELVFNDFGIFYSPEDHPEYQAYQEMYRDMYRGMYDMDY